MGSTPEPYFEILAPAAWTAPALFNSPHSGRLLPADLLTASRLSRSNLRKSEDCFVDELFEGCVDLGAPLLRANVARVYVDLNREPYEFDPRMFSDDLPGYMNTGSPRVAGGLGTIPRVVTEGEEIYRTRLSLSEGLSRIEQIYRPYHRTLAALLNQVHAATGQVLLVDCHSMPSSAVSELSRQVDVVIGDRFGSACQPEIADLLEQLLLSEGLRVIRNRPYAGGFITQTHGAPRTGRNAVQIELNRKLYLDEVRFEKTSNFVALKEALNRCMRTALEYTNNQTQVSALAAE
jgi:N-formylglutamate amidohydrolase